jgi:hypothetical protein
MTEKRYYHGTFWLKAESHDEVEESAFFNLDSGYSDLGVVYVTNLEETAVYFSKWNTTSDAIQVILRGALLTDKLLERSAYDLQRNSTIEIDGVGYEVGDREQLFDAMRTKFDGFNTVGNYDGRGDDIVLFDAGNFSATEARLLIDGQWTDWLDREQAVEAFTKICGLEAAPLAI